MDVDEEFYWSNRTQEPLQKGGCLSFTLENILAEGMMHGKTETGNTFWEMMEAGDGWGRGHKGELSLSAIQ